MKCPRCSCLEDKVIDSRMSKERSSVRRRRECTECSHRFTTLEEIIQTEIFVIKHDERRQEFNPFKIRDGIKKACWKRPIKENQINDLVAKTQQYVENFGEREIASEKIGEFVMEQLKTLDDIAYVRFASVYRKFKDIDQFIREIRRLRDADFS